MNLQLIDRRSGTLDDAAHMRPAAPEVRCTAAGIATAAELLAQAQSPTHLRRLGRHRRDGRSARASPRDSARPVSTTLQGMSAFPANHPLHAGFCLGRAAVPAVEEAFDGLRLPAGGRYAVRRNCDRQLRLESAREPDPRGRESRPSSAPIIRRESRSKATRSSCCRSCSRRSTALPAIPRRDARPSRRRSLRTRRRTATMARARLKGRVNPARFFMSLRQQLADDATVVLDDGNHTFLAAELMPIHQPRGLISPTDFNCMGYCVPAAIGAKLARPATAQVVGIVGDGAFRMTAMELATATALGTRRRSSSCSATANSRRSPRRRRSRTTARPARCWGRSTSRASRRRPARRSCASDADADIDAS